LKLIAEFYRNENPRSVERKPRWLAQARDLIYARSAERLTLSQIGREVGIHPVYLAREFRRHYRCTVGEYIRQIRIEAACVELKKPQRSIAEIAQRAVFTIRAILPKRSNGA